MSIRPAAFLRIPRAAWRQPRPPRLATTALCLGLAAMVSPATAAQAPDESPARSGEWGFRPADGAATDRNPPSFSWRPQDGATRYTLQIADTPGFQAIESQHVDLRWNVCCPDRVLPAGDWYWRFRVETGDGRTAPGDWSQVRRFHVATDARPFPLPPRDELLARIPDQHPRLFLRPEDLPALRALAHTERAGSFEPLIRQCDAWLADPPPTDEPPRYPPDVERKSEEWRELWWGNRRRTIAVLEAAATLAFTWRLDDNPEYAALARRLLMDAAAWDPRGATGYRYNDEAGMPYAYHFSRTYTFLHPFLDESERARCREVMRVRGREMYEHLAPRHLWQPYSSHSNRAWHFLGEVGIAFHDELPEADDWVDFAVQVFANVYPVWSDADGGWHEGAAYWNSYLSRFTWWADVQKAALGLDAYRLPFFASAGDYAMYLMPPGTTGGGFGDLTARRTSASHRDLMTVFATQAANPYWAWYVERTGGADFGAGHVGFLRGAMPAVPARAPDDRPTSRLFRGTGQAVLNTTLLDAADNVAVIFKSSPFGTQSHGYEAQNSFLLYAYGERLLIRTGRRDMYGSAHHTQWMWQTKSVNSITLDGAGQRVHSADATGCITDFHTEPGLHTVEGEAADAYGDRVESFRRRIVLLEPDLVLIVDRLRTPGATPMEWRLHAPAPFQQTASDTFEVHQGDAACRVRFLEPATLTFTQTDQFDPPPRERIQLVEHHLTAAREATDEALFVTLIRTWRAGAEAPGEAQVQSNPERVSITAPLATGSAELQVRVDASVAIQTWNAAGEKQLEWQSLRSSPSTRR